MQKQNSSINLMQYSGIPMSFLSRLFNIAPPQWGRVMECWLITLFFKVGSAIGWTILTAAFIGQFGIARLPFLFILNAGLIIISTVFFERFIMKMKREVLMIVMIFVGAVLLFFASLTYGTSPIAFFTLVILAESIFFAQFSVFIPILVGDRFTPIESQSTFPFVESGETIGGIAGGFLVSALGTRLPVKWFIYAWILCLACVIVVFVVTSVVRKGVPHIPLHMYRARGETRRHEVKEVISAIRKTPFLKSLVVIVCLQWLFMNVLDFQFTKSVEQSITHTQEQTLALESGAVFQASILGDAFGADKVGDEANRALSTSEQALLSERLGALKGGFHVAALFVQAFVATRLIGALGVVGSMMLHPIIMLLSLVGMFFKFGVLSSTVTRMNFEITNVVHKNAYFASHYALPKAIRDQAAEFLEGVVRPFGTVVGMAGILLLQMLFVGEELSMWIHTLMIVMMLIVLFITLRLRQKYTDVTTDQLSSEHLPYPDKLNAIEILAQHGHNDAPAILAEKLSHLMGKAGHEVHAVRLKLLSVLGDFADYDTLPEILTALGDPDPEIRLEAAHALMNFTRIGEHFYTQAFSRHRIIELLKETFRTETSASVRSAIIRVFSLIREADVVPFLLSLLNEADEHTKAECIYTFGLFKDPNAAFYIEPFLSDPHALIRANALAALWQFGKYQERVENELHIMIESNDFAMQKAALHAIGDLQLVRNFPVKEFLTSSNEELSVEAAFALTKSADREAFLTLLDYFIRLPDERFNQLRRFINRVSPRARDMIHRVLLHMISLEVQKLTREHNETAQINDLRSIEKLRRLYRLVENHEELYALESLFNSLTPHPTP